MEFYSETRFRNWLEKIKETEVRENDPSTLTVFDQLLEDFVIACMNIVDAVKGREIKKSDALKEIEKISRIISEKYDFNDEMKNDLFEFTIESIKAVLASFRVYFEGKMSKKDFQSLLNDALKKEAKGDLEGAFDVIARMGAKVIKGEKLPELEFPEDSIVLSWLDGIDAINAVMELSEIDASVAD